LIVGTDPLPEFRHREHASGFHHRPFPMYPCGFNGIEPGTRARSSIDNHATTALVFGGPVVGFDPLLHRLTDMPGGIVPDEQESPLALGRKVCGQPCKNNTGHRTDGTPLDKTSEHVVRRGHIEAITGDRFPLWILGWYRLFHQADGLVIAPGMHLGLGFAAPPDFIFEAQRAVRMLRGHLDEAVPAVFFRS
jgi:hypothetical protein